MKKTSLLILIIIGVAIAVYLYINSNGIEDERAPVSEVMEEQEEETVERGVVSETQSGEKRYYSEGFGFSFVVPSEFSVGEFDEGGGRVVLVQSGTGDDAFQIFITPWDEPEQTITPERILRDLSDMEIHQPEGLSMDGGERRALTFVSTDPSYGQTREVWFVYHDHLYQIMTHRGAQDFLASVLETWEFVN